MEFDDHIDAMKNDRMMKKYLEIANRKRGGTYNPRLTVVHRVQDSHIGTGCKLEIKGADNGL